MSAPFATADALAVFMVQEVGPLGADLGLDTSAYAAAVDDALYAFYGDAGGVISDITSVADVRKLRALARVEAWQTVVTASAADINSSTDGQSLSLSDRYAHAVGRLADARARAAQYSSDNMVLVTPITYTGDPYARPVRVSEFG